MKQKNYIAIGIITAALFISCQKTQENKYAKLEKMSWLIGQWENKMPYGVLTETWTKDNDSTFSGKSYFIKNEKDTVHSESIILTQIKDELVYRPTVKGQNNDEPVEFKLTADLDNSFAFENPKHDFPQKIVYKKVNDKSLLATISGNQGGKPVSESYPMTKK